MTDLGLELIALGAVFVLFIDLAGMLFAPRRPVGVPEEPERRYHVYSSAEVLVLKTDDLDEAKRARAWYQGWIDFDSSL